MVLAGGLIVFTGGLTLVAGSVGVAHACARVDGFPWDHGLTTGFGGGEEEVFAEGEAGTIRSSVAI
eukprot:CCRYP_009187-RB/>CCRYP_009187-RB protein AED:0.47 eAED:1.00 QI:0/0/0/1/0/0/3/0/65